MEVEFETNGKFRMDDYWLPQDAFLQQLKDMNLDDFILDYEERRVIKQNRDNAQINEIRSGLDQFYIWFAKSLINLFDEVPFKKFKTYLDGTADAK